MINANEADQTIVFGALAAKLLTQPSVTVAAGATSGLAVTFTTTTPTVCSATGTNGTTVKLLKAGTCRVRADQAGDANYNAAPVVTQSFAVSKSTQTITFNALPVKTLGQAQVLVIASASSKLAVTFTSATPTVCRAGGPAAPRSRCSWRERAPCAPPRRATPSTRRRRR